MHVCAFVCAHVGVFMNVCLCVYDTEREREREHPACPLAPAFGGPVCGNREVPGVQKLPFLIGFVGTRAIEIICDSVCQCQWTKNE